MTEEKISKISNALLKSVKKDCKSNVSISFSGGIDSSLIAKYLSTKNIKPDTFSVFFKDTNYDESKKITDLLDIIK